MSNADDEPTDALDHDDFLETARKDLENFLSDILNELPVAVFVKEAQERRFVFVNRDFASLYQVDPANLIGKNNEELLATEEAAYVREKDLQVLEHGERIEIPEEILNLPKGRRVLHTRKIPLTDDQDRRPFMLGTLNDVTESKEARDALQREREMLETEKRLLEVIRELSMPVIPVFEGILVVPLVGHIDSDRGAHFLEALLAGIQKHRAETVLIDITGVPMMDADVAERLVHATRAAALLGTTCILVGASPDVARTLVELGIDLGELMPQRDLRAGILYALSHQGKGVVKRRSP